MIDFLVYLQQFRNPFLDFLVEAITITAEETTLLIAICIIYWCISKKMGYIVAFAVVLSSCMNETIKEIFKGQYGLQCFNVFVLILNVVMIILMFFMFLCLFFMF